MTWTLCTSGAAVLKAGTNANATIAASGSALSKWSDEAEGRIEAETRLNFVDNYASLSTGVKNILSDVCSSLVAMNIIAYDTTGYLSREADALLNVNDDKATRGLAALKNFKSKSMSNP